MSLLFPLLLLSAALSLAVSASWYCYYRILRRPTKAERHVALPSAKVVDVELGVGRGLMRVVERYTWEDIRAFTSEFSSAVIGEGGFSTVYLASLPGSVVGAVKVHHVSERLRRAFLKELEVLRCVRHENVVRLLGYSDEGEQGALVFEYVPNGTLHDKLHGMSSPWALPWSHRMSIAFQIATALDYLHESCSLPIVHNDVKPSNVLLDDDLRSKLCDFGSASMGFSSTITPTPHHHMVGSPGYVDPHYVRTGIVSKKGDVYGFGVVVLELMTGREAFSAETGRAVLPEVGVGEGWEEEWIDGRLGGEYVKEEAEVMAEVVRRCVAARPSVRPAMGEVVEVMREKVRSAMTVAVDRRSDGGGGEKKRFSVILQDDNFH